MTSPALTTPISTLKPWVCDMLYNVAYDRLDGSTELYLGSHVKTHKEAEVWLKQWKEYYLDKDGKPKAYPNGKGFYQVKNPRIVVVKK